MKARALWFTAPLAVEVREIDVADPGDGQILVRAECSGISAGTEMLAYRGEVDATQPLDERIGSLAGTFAYPFRFGYCAVGTVERSEGRLSEGATVFAFHPHQDRFVVDESDALLLEGVGPRAGTLYPLVETALQVSLDAGLRPAEHAVVAGLGPVGILCGAMLRRAGVEVLGIDPIAFRRKIADAFGVPAVEPPDAQGAVAERTQGRGADVVVEASGRPEALSSALGLLAHEGTVVVCSWYGTKPVPLPLGAEFHRRRLTIRSSQVSTIPAHLSARWDRARRTATALRLLRELPVSLLATHEYAFERAAEAYAAIHRGTDDLLHAALRYR